MKRASFVLCCLVTLGVFGTAFAQEQEESETVSCKQQAVELGLTDQEAIDAYIEECEAAEGSWGSMEDEEAPAEGGSSQE